MDLSLSEPGDKRRGQLGFAKQGEEKVKCAIGQVIRNGNKLLHLDLSYQN